MFNVAKRPYMKLTFHYATVMTRLTVRFPISGFFAVPDTWERLPSDNVMRYMLGFFNLLGPIRMHGHLLQNAKCYFGSTRVFSKISRLQCGHFRRRVENVMRHARI